MGKSLLDLAFEVISSKSESCSFDDLWNEICEQAGVDSGDISKKSRFYTNIMLDGRFVTLGENQWDLRSRHTFDKVHIDMKDAYSDEVVSESNEDENEENYDNDLTETDDDNSENED